MKSRVGHYEIVAELGRGGMGVVYKGYEPALARYVAIKELAPVLAHDGLLVERFLREARAMAALNDPHIVQIYAIGQQAQPPYFVMEYVDGEPLAQLLARHGRLAPADALQIACQAATGLAVAHDHGVIHRDIKPANLLLTRRGQVKVADFGIALAHREFDSKLTGTGQLVGTPGYLSPEVCLGQPVDRRSDVFALGIVLFEMLAGKAPFSDASPLQLMLDVVQAEVPDVRSLNREVDAEAARILARMLAKDPQARYPDMHALLSDLRRHPLLAAGTSFGIAIASHSATTVAMATPVTPREAHTTAAPLATEAATRPGTTRASASAAAPAWRHPAVAGVVVIVLAAGAWALHTAVRPGPPAPADGVATPAAVAGAAESPERGRDRQAPEAPPAPMPPTPPPNAGAVPAAVAGPAATPAANPAAAKALRRFAVQREGEARLTGPAQRLVEAELVRAGFIRVVDPARADLIVQVRAEVVELPRRPLLRRTAAPAAAFLVVRPFRQGKPLGPGIRQRIDYSPGTAEADVVKALRTPVGRLADALRAP